jgi:hypothetical protein
MGCLRRISPQTTHDQGSAGGRGWCYWSERSGPPSADGLPVAQHGLARNHVPNSTTTANPPTTFSALPSPIKRRKREKYDNILRKKHHLSVAGRVTFVM